MLGQALICVLGLLVGGILGGSAVYLLQQIRIGAIRVPPTLGVGPVKLDISGLSDVDQSDEVEFDAQRVKPVFETGGSVAGGCMSILGASLVLIGFLLPWFSCNLAYLISGSYSGFSALVQMIVAFILSLFGATGSREFTEIGGALVIILLLAIIFVGLIPLAGISIGRAGLRMFQSLRTTNEEKRRVSKALIRTAVIGLSPLLCYLASATANIDFSALGLLGAPIQLKSANTGLWVTFAGFVVAIMAGLVISVTASLTEQAMKPSLTNQQE